MIPIFVFPLLFVGCLLVCLYVPTKPQSLLTRLMRIRVWCGLAGCLCFSSDCTICGAKRRIRRSSAMSNGRDRGAGPKCFAASTITTPTWHWPRHDSSNGRQWIRLTASTRLRSKFPGKMTREWEGECLWRDKKLQTISSSPSGGSFVWQKSIEIEQIVGWWGRWE